MTKISDDPPMEEVRFETGGKDSFVDVVAGAHGYRCEGCNKSALDRPLFVDATATTDHQNDERWFFFLKSATLRCGACGGGEGIEAGLPENRERLDELLDGETGDSAPDFGEATDHGAEDSTPMVPRAGAGGSGATRPERPADDSSEEDHPYSGMGLDDEVIAPTDPRRNDDSAIGGPRGRGKGIGSMTTADEFDPGRDTPSHHQLGEEVVRLSGVRDVGPQNTFLGRICSLTYRRGVLVGLGAVLVGVLAAEFAGIAVGAALVEGARLGAGVIAATVGWPVAMGGLAIGSYAVFLYERERRGWPPTPSGSEVDMLEERRRLRLLGGGALAVSSVAVVGGVAAGLPLVAPAVVVGGAGTAAALQFRRLHAATILETGAELRSGILSGLVRGGVVVGAVGVVAAPSVTAALAAGALPGVLALGAGKWVADAEADSPPSPNEER